MRISYLLVLFSLLVSCSQSVDSIYTLGPSQSMSITGLGLGQDAAYNPYGDENSAAVISNIGSTTFSIRLQENGEITLMQPIEPHQEKTIQIPKGSALYLDSEEPGKAKVIFKKAVSTS